jgi:hypothetical protein
MTVVTPPVDLGASQQKRANLVVVTQAGTASEQRATHPNAIAIQPDRLTPVITILSPRSGPLAGGARITIFGEGFQAPVQVFFGDVEAQIIVVTFSEIVVITPAALTMGDVPIRIVNVSSGTSVTLDPGYNYHRSMVIQSVQPMTGSTRGGTRVTIDGDNFRDPVSVIIGGVVAQPIRVSAKQIVAITSAASLQGCADHSGPVQVTDLDDGDVVEGAPFTYVPLRPSFLNAPAKAVAGATITVKLAGVESPRFTIDGQLLSIRSAVVNGDETTSFVLQIPVELTQARDCRDVKPFAATLRVVNGDGGCDTTVPIVIQLPAGNHDPCDDLRRSRS